MKIIGSRPVTIAEAKDIISKRSAEELEYEQQQAAEHAEKFARRSSEDSRKMVKELMESNGKLDQDTAIKIVDISPKRPETVKAIILRKGTEMSDAEIADLLKVLQK